MSNEKITLRYDITRGDFIRGGEASTNIKKALMQLGINNQIIKKICISCYEAEMNIVIHSMGGSLEVIIGQNEIEIYAEDYGPGIEDISLAMTEGFSTATNEAREMGFGGGMGLPNMKRSCDKFEINSVLGKYTKIKMIVYIKGDVNGRNISFC